MLEKQKTIAEKISIQGFGTKTKKKITITFKPAPENTGFIFIRTDIGRKNCIKADFSFLLKEKIDKGIILEKNGLKIYAIEHVLSALTGMDLDNVIIELDNIEPPIIEDYSYKFFVDVIEKAGIIEQNAKRKYYSIKEIIDYENKKTGGEIIALPCNDFEIMIITDSELFVQDVISKYLNRFGKKIKNKSNFCFYFKEKTVIKRIDYLSKKENKIKIIKNNMRSSFISIFSNEKNDIAKCLLLDFIGFLSLIGLRLKGKFIFYNPDNYIFLQLLNNLKNQINKVNEIKYIPEFNIEKKPIFDIKNIMNILPHKPPFLLVDKIIDLKNDYIIGVKNVTMNESFFIGHFPNEPIMPGVLQIEAIAQVGGILILNKFKNPELYSTYFIKIDNVKFKHKIVPGDIIIFQVHLLNSLKRGIVHMKGKGFVNKKLVVEAEVIAKIVKVKKNEQY
ncbi:bifunctional UDP-3-O-[3-hydroxymyristoyl] N-acetylglucosamine deacetylase/3-hydroxyacyl-ACP dehydratase [Blattabacterium cuenoti]|uniref:bifunctional UDP-3-O-[3-hydroxymyristoyl] N-acetylglucosamine deacetylase/3-hydroxyacyl-ACP dehydratase n=1 Tax=Blattabacterium cuenoti TaxID=1653831 RepID=UPI00163CED71|nr:bifunctional UDP-3-O-[3-hydroxymyristoyl] N-acetylglucosamine deacetylase/3-hydroxyacyl-ACP dehydratase [Blattabacterium cuenoti]